MGVPAEKAVGLFASIRHCEPSVALEHITLQTRNAGISTSIPNADLITNFYFLFHHKWNI